MKQEGAIENYETIVFDCDGVILDSNRVKTEAFYYTTLPYGKDLANAMVDYHMANGGISRYQKFEYFLNIILPADVESNEHDFETLLENYARFVTAGLIDCDITPKINDLRLQSKSRWLIVSGGDQDELRTVFSKRKLSKMFDGGIYGSPDSKNVILDREIQRGNIKFPALFLGDSKYDYEAAKANGLDFIFVSDWTEVKAWESWVKKSDINHISKVIDLVFNDETHV